MSRRDQKRRFSRRQLKAFLRSEKKFQPKKKLNFPNL
jgi:hypothetical protein